MCWCKAKVLRAVFGLGHLGGGVFDMLTDAVRDQVGESGRFGEDAGQVFKCCCTVVLTPPVPLGGLWCVLDVYVWACNSQA